MEKNIKQFNRKQTTNEKAMEEMQDGRMFPIWENEEKKKKIPKQ